ncbi:hypothetical protein J0675_25610, partial [Vibrio parahaemolyticus]|nr:hypothetical protein [Vibrio parahaemolyticus]
MNGVLNFSILDGWWPEGFNHHNGFAIGGTETGNSETVDLEDATALYETLENDVIPTFYSDDNQGFSVKWVTMMKNSISS